MNRHTRRDRRSPGGIRAGVKVGGEIERDQFAILIAAAAKAHARMESSAHVGKIVLEVGA